jgi:hypothetical protein
MDDGSDRRLLAPDEVAAMCGLSRNVIEELEGAERRSAEDAIREARAKLTPAKRRRRMSG